MQHEILTIKLNECNKQFDEFQKQLMHYQNESDSSKIKHMLETLEKDYQKHEQMLRNRAETSHSSAASSLSACQLAYCQECETILKQALSAPQVTEFDTEMMALFAEFAIDYAALSMQYALMAGLAAIDMQINIDKRSEEELK